MKLTSQLQGQETRGDRRTEEAVDESASVDDEVGSLMAGDNQIMLHHINPSI